MEIMISIGSRLREIREAMGFSQTDFALIAASAGVPGATRQSQAKYEKGQAAPSAAYLAAIAQEGADVQYVLTGVRSSLALTPNEKLLLERFRDSSKERQDAALGALLGFGAVKEKSDFHNVFHGGVGQVVERIESGSVNVVNMGSDKKK